MKNKDIFWGVVLMVIGGLIALRNFDIFYFSWRSLFSLWPFLLIFWGIAILPLKHSVKLSLSLVTVVIAIIMLINSPVRNNHWRFWNFDNYTEEYDEQDDEFNEQQFSDDFTPDIKKAKLKLEAAAGKFRINGSTSKLFDFENKGSGIYEATTDKIDGIPTIKIENTNTHLHSGDNSNDSWLALNTEPVWLIDIDAGAASLDIDLSDHKVEKIDIDGGAAGIKLRLGNTIKNATVTINAGASGIKIKIPEEAACEIRATTVLSSLDLNEFEKIDKNLYQTSNFSDTTNQIFINIDAAVSGLKVIRY
jgi:hypothetical protein